MGGVTTYGDMFHRIVSGTWRNPSAYHKFYCRMSLSASTCQWNPDVSSHKAQRHLPTASVRKMPCHLMLLHQWEALDTQWDCANLLNLPMKNV